MGLGQLPPQSAAPVVMNVAGGLRVEAFLGLEFRGYFADIRLFRNQSALIRWARLPQCSSERSR
jgi:hypothetical protein